ncbi:Lrp/AsnC ligand binding domain-containing protein [Nitrosopumilus ureiphilus]|uniref:AsnC family transcriptional regulator n=1 Tax=Nitrosopumilus ureiphilus TaxID=1470067 RepID=A0A7D5RDJ9_9ARCH|nr:Lrp/AsnC ligand binding domain-containing protein [Nitrosopumilus ureiphilus]QLH06323.1 AsnC family transcriptional regulator [Nitrosopumilus ureiphilus]
MIKAYVLILNKAGTEDSIIFHLKNIPSIVNAFGTFGSYDIIAKLISDNEENIFYDITNRIRKIPNIRSTLTLFVDKKPGISKTNNIEQKVLDEHMAQAFVIIHCTKANESKVLTILEQIPEVIEADILVGNYDITCKIVSPTYNDISEIVSNKIRKISEIKSTITINVVNNQGFSR